MELATEAPALGLAEWVGGGTSWRVKPIYRCCREPWGNQGERRQSGKGAGPPLVYPSEGLGRGKKMLEEGDHPEGRALTLNT